MIAIIIGTRAELIKVFPVMLELQQRDIPYFFIHTGQHNLGDFCELFGVKRPDIILTKEPTKSSKFYSKIWKALFWNLEVCIKIKKELNKRPELKHVLFHGDTMTTATASVASCGALNFLNKFKNVHLEAGLRSENIREPFPEELSRKLADAFSHVLLVSTRRGYNNVKGYKNKKVYLVGNTISDSSAKALKLCKNKKRLSKGKFALITIHRHENIKNKKRMEAIVEILESIPIKSFFALHDNTKRKLIKFNLYNRLKKNKKIKIIKPMSYIDFIYQLSKCDLILCDGGSMQEESLLFNKPCIVLRKETERQEGLKTNFQFLSRFNVGKTKQKILEYLNPNFKVKKVKNPYGKNVSKKIVQILMRKQND
jgi:UDP-N-acetylglucosamine 2-epimerase (non-hydrolysing)